MKHFFKKFYRSWFFELLLAAILLLLFLAYVNREAYSAYFSGAEDFLINKAPSAITGLIDSALALLSPKVLAGIIGVIILALIVIWRVLWRMRKSAKSKTYTCPKCARPLVRIHRKGWQKVVSKVLPVRRLYCRNCGWRGLRLKEIDNLPMDSASTGETTNYNIDKIKG